MVRFPRLTTSILALATAGSLLVACKQQAPGVPPIGSMEAGLGLDAGASPPLAYAPSAEALPAGPPLMVSALGPAPNRYRYIDDAYQMVDAFGDSPPDYAFDYSGTEPWVWRSDSGYYRVAEAVPGGYREYYYGPRDDAPFLVRDPRYSYAYEAGALVAVYDIYGRAQPANFVARQGGYAGRYYARARMLHAAALNQARRAPYADQWRSREAELANTRRRWSEESGRDVEWRRLRDERPAVQQAVWSQERQQRMAQAGRAAPPARQPQHQPHSQPQPVMTQVRGPSMAPAQHDMRSSRGAAPIEAQRPAQVAQASRQAHRAEAAQQHAAQVAAREPARADLPKPQARVQQAERGAPHAQAPQAQAQRREERVRIEPQRQGPQRMEAPNAQAHGQPAAQHGGGGPKGGGPKGGDRGGDKHDRR